MTIPNRVFIRNLPFDITEKEVIDVFKQFGNISNPVFLKDRGIAFLTYQDQKMYEKCRSMDGKITIKGRVIGVCEAKKNQTEDNFSNYYNQNDYDYYEYEDEDTLFVGNIPTDIEDYEVREAFMKYQPYEVKLCDGDKYTIQYAYIRILKPELIDRALSEMNGYNLKGSIISVSIAKNPMW